MELSHDELLDAQAHVWNHIFNFINSMSLKCAIQLRIPDIIHNHGKPITLSELINALPSLNKAKSKNLYRLMRILVHSKFFVRDEEERYWLTPASRLLLVTTNEPRSVAPFALSMLDPLLMDPWHGLDKWFQNDESTPYANTHKKELWDHALKEPRLNDLFNEGMASDARLVNTILHGSKECKDVFAGLESIVDVAGGTGTVAKAIAEAYPGLKCVVLDLPHVVADLQGNGNNLTYVAGDMFKFIPPANAVFMKWILHDWSDEECVKILEKCKEAIPSKNNGGKVIIVDIVVDEGKQANDKDNHEAVETKLFFDMLMMVVVKGKERTEKEWAKIFFDAGFTSYKITPDFFGLRSLIQVYP